MTFCFDNIALVETNEVSNGTFDAGIQHWWKGRAQTTIAAESGQLRIDTPGGTTNRGTTSSASAASRCAPVSSTS